MPPVIRPSFFPDMEAPVRQRGPRPVAAGASRRLISGNPCLSCPCYQKAIPVLPNIPTTAKALALGLAPGETEEELKTPFVGVSGQLLREALAAGGFDPVVDIGYLNLSRCRPAGDLFEGKEWEKMVSRCWYFVQQALASFQGPVLLLGTEACSKFLGQAKKKGERRVRVTRVRGLWFHSAGRWLMAARHPSNIARSKNDFLREQFFGDVARFAGRVLNTVDLPPVDFTVYQTVAEAAPVLRKLAKLETPFSFDIETYDAAQCPSRKGVAVDPCHPDFRVRGLALAWSPNEAAYIELLNDENNKGSARPLLTKVFQGPAVKRAFNGSFDEEGLIMQGWVDSIHNRAEDGMLGMLALDMTHQSGFSLQRGVVDILGEPYHWEADKSLIRQLPLQQVAEGCVRDAAATWRLCQELNVRLQREQYY